MLKQWYLLVAAVICTACVSHSTPSNSNQANETQYYLGKPAHQQAQAIASGEITSAALVKGYLARIEQLDGKVNSVLSVNPNALEEANAIDKQLANGKTLGPLAGIPVLLKDNIESEPGNDFQSEILKDANDIISDYDD